MSDYDVVQLARLEPPYLERLGLHSPPFAPTHEDRFLYLDNARLQLLNMLQHLTEYSSLLLMVTGERGVGKTSLLQRFIAQARPEWLLCPIQAHTMMDADQLLYAVAQGLGLPAPPHDPGSLQDVLYQQLLKLREQNRIPILLIDDAHELPLDALQAVFHLADTEAGDGSLLRTILFCEPQIETMLEDPAIQSLRERITHSLELPPLDAEQTVEYLRHRLEVAGYGGALPFSERQLQQIYKSSGGLPEKINEAAHEILSQNPDRPAPAEPGPGRRLKPVHAGLALLLLGLAGAVLLLQDDINRLFEEPTVPSTPTSFPAPSQTPTPQPDQAPDLASDQHPDRASDRPQARPPDQNRLTDTEISGAPKSREPVSGSATRPTRPAAAGAVGGALTTVTPTGTDTSTATVSGQQPSSAPAAAARVAGPDTVSTRTGAAPAASSPSPASASSKTPESSPASTPATTVTGADVPAMPAVSAAPAGDAPAGLWDTAWLQRRNPDHFTLQILASHSKRNIEAFVRQHGLGGKAVAFTSRRNGAPFYALLIGDYPDRQHAEQAIARLPASLRQQEPALKPWIRSFASIQQGLTITGTTTRTTAGVATQPPPASTRLTDHVAWLWSQDPSHYTLQLLGGYDRRGVLRFMQQSQLLGKAAYYQTRRNGRDWYVVVYGSYPNRPAARAALNELPAGIRKTRPFVRQFSEIHAQLPHPGPAG